MNVSEASWRRQAVDALRSSAVAAAFATTTIGALFAGHTLRILMGDVGYTTALIGLCVVGVAMLIARRSEWMALRIVPASLFAFLVWLLLTAFWSSSPEDTVSGWLRLLVPTFLAVVCAQFRDTLQLVRHTGDVLRVLLGASLGIEILSGILLDLPIPFLHIGGNIATGGPIQGLFGTGTRLGFVAIIALITFLVEWRTRSVASGLSLFSVALAAGVALFTASPIVLLMAFVTLLTTGILAVVRRANPARRSALQWAIASAVVIGGILIYFFRRPLVYWLNAEPDFLVRSKLWNVVLDVAARHPVEGWGWVGEWPALSMPYTYIRLLTQRAHWDASNAWMDVLLQAGAVGVVLLAVVVGLALTRAWITASEKRSTVYTWPALVLVVLLTDSVFTSALLEGFGWFLLVLCVVCARNSLSWRQRLEPPPTTGTLPVHRPTGEPGA